MSVWNRNTTAIAAILVSLAALPSRALPQVRAGATISLIARLPGSVTLQQQQIPLSITVTNGKQFSMPSVVDVKWNLDPHETQSFRVVATYKPSSTTARPLLISIDGSEPRPLLSNARVVLFNMPINFQNRQGRLQKAISVSFDGTDNPAPADGQYRGSLILETEQQ